MFRSPLIRSTMLLDFFATFFSSATALLPIFAQDILQVGATGYGWLYAAPAAGALVASATHGAADGADRAPRADAAVGGRRLRRGNRRLRLSRSFWLTFACLALVGATDTVSTIIRNIVRQLETPDRLRGRMTGVNMVFFMGGPQLGELEAGAVANWLGATFSVVSGGTRLSARHRVGGGDHADAARLSARRGGENGRRAVTTIVIGLISDTHGLLRPQVAAIFGGVDLILHAGDVGGRAVLQGLRQIAPVQAVYGNVDDAHDPDLAAERSLAIGGVTIHVSHGHEIGRPTPPRLLARYPADVVIFGHTHRAAVVRGEGQRMAVNPGAAGPKRFDLLPSVARLTIQNGAAAVEIVSLAGESLSHEST